MHLPTYFYLLILTAVVTVAVGVYSYVRVRKTESDLKKKEEEMSRRMFELSILKELGDRVGYSLDVHQIIDVITGSLRQFIEYSAVSYMLINPEKILFNIH